VSATVPDEGVNPLDALHTPPQPLPDTDSAGFWEATAKGELSLCRCDSCGLWMQPPLERCRKCNATTSYQPISGHGEVNSFIVQHRPVTVGYLDNVPYVVAIIEFDEQKGLRLPGRIVDMRPGEVTVGMRVKARLDNLPGGDFVVPVFVRAS
jgi:uncharacterized OB-fold protein